MEDQKKLQQIIDRPIATEMKESFIDYAMSVIVSRAIPDSRDGLKPVHRRILYAMDQLEMFHNKPFKKSARVVGEVIAKYHPHGDSAVYESMVRMAQSFSLRYPLIWGQGNFGSIDGDSAAAMRYTEAKLKKIALLLLDDLNKETVDFKENYDGSEREPVVLPGKLPNLLMNGSTGIAVGMATSIPPHNLTDLLNASIAIARNPEISIDEIIDIVVAPDFPTKALIINKSEIREAYKTGRGRVMIRAKTQIITNDEQTKNQIIVTEIPYMVNKSMLMTKISELIKEKQIESISDLKDESSREGIRVVITLKRNYIPEVELNKLFKMTSLQQSFPINLLALVGERPKTLNLKTALVSYIEHQYEILVRKTKFLLAKAEARKHILEGLSIALNHIDEVIALIKKASDTKDAIDKLRQSYGLSELQAKAILDMKLQRLTGLERKNLEEEINVLNAEIVEHKNILTSKEVQTNKIVEMFEQIKEEFGDERLTEVSPVDLGNIEDENMIKKEDVIVTMTNNGYVKRIPIDEYKTQNRGGIGVKSASVNDNDFIINFSIANTHTDILFFTNKGKVFKLRTHMIPSLSKIAKGLPLINLINIEKDEKPLSFITVENYDNKSLIFFTEKGLIKKTEAIEYARVNKNGKIALVLKENDSLLGVDLVDNNMDIDVMIGNNNGKSVKFKLSDVRNVGRKASGVRGINIKDGSAIDYAISSRGNKVLALSEEGYGKLTSIEEYRLTNRGSSGVKTINVDKAGKLVALKIVRAQEEDIMIITNKGTTIRTSVEKITEQSRNTKGVKIINLREGEKIVSTTIVKKEEEIENLVEKTIEISIQ